MHLVIGANGRVGRRVTEELIKVGEKPRVLVRDASKATERFGDRTEIAVGDLDDNISIAKAMHDVSSIFLCCPVNPNQVKQQNAVVDEAAKAKAYLVKVSGLATFPGSFVDSGRWHAETEHYMANSGVSSTCLHPFFFMQNMDFQLASIQEDGLLKSAVHSVALAMVDTRDIAAVAATLMLNPDLATGQTLPLTCGEAITYKQMAEQMSEVFQRPVSFCQQDFTEVEANLLRSGLPDWHIQIILQFNRAFNEGYGSEVHTHVQEILGRPPFSFRDYLETVSVLEKDTNPFPS